MNSEITNIRKSTYLQNDTTVKLLIQSLVLSHLDYCSTVWSCAPKQELLKLQLIQNRAERLALRWGAVLLAWQAVLDDGGGEATMQPHSPFEKHLHLMHAQLLVYAAATNKQSAQPLNHASCGWFYSAYAQDQCIGTTPPISNSKN